MPRISNSAVAAAPPSAATFLFCQFSQQFGVCSSAVVREPTLYEGSCCFASTVSDGFSPPFTLSPLLLSLYWTALPGTDFTCKKKAPSELNGENLEQGLRCSQRASRHTYTQTSLIESKCPVTQPTDHDSGRAALDRN